LKLSVALVAPARLTSLKMLEVVSMLALNHSLPPLISICPVAALASLSVHPAFQTVVPSCLL
jgi:hypothetical protein